MAVLLSQVVDKFPGLMWPIRFQPEQKIENLNTPELATATSLIFVSSAHLLKHAEGSSARTWVVNAELLESVPENIPSVLATKNVQLAMALIGETYFRASLIAERQLSGTKIHPTAVIASSAKIGAGCHIGPGVVIGESCVIGDHVYIGSNTVIENHVQIGANSVIHPLVFVAHHCEIGRACEIHPHTTIGSEGFGYAQDPQKGHVRLTHFGKVVLEDRVHIGANVCIDRGTFAHSQIGAGTKIDNHCHFAHNIIIGKNCLITAGAITAGSVTIGDNCVFGGRATVAGHLQIADGVRLGGLTGVTKTIDHPGEYAGHPIQTLSQDLKTRAAMKKLPQLIKQISRLLSSQENS